MAAGTIHAVRHTSPGGATPHLPELPIIGPTQQGPLPLAANVGALFDDATALAMAPPDPIGHPGAEGGLVVEAAGAMKGSPWAMFGALYILALTHQLAAQEANAPPSHPGGAAGAVTKGLLPDGEVAVHVESGQAPRCAARRLQGEPGDDVHDVLSSTMRYKPWRSRRGASRHASCLRLSRNLDRTRTKRWKAGHAFPHRPHDPSPASPPISPCAHRRR